MTSASHPLAVSRVPPGVKLIFGSLVLVAGLIWGAFSYVNWIYRDKAHRAAEEDPGAAPNSAIYTIDAAAVSEYLLDLEWTVMMLDASNPHNVALQKAFFAAEHQAALNPAASVEAIAKFAAANKLTSATESLDAISYCISIPPDHRPYLTFEGSNTDFATLHHDRFAWDTRSSDKTEASARQALGLK